MVKLSLYLLALKWAQEQLNALRTDVFINILQNIYCF